MAQGSKSKYTDKQKRMAEHIEEGYEKSGIKGKEAARRAWATVNKETHGGKKPGGSGYGKRNDYSSSRKGGHIAGKAHSKRSRAAKKGWQTRRGHERKAA